MTRNLTSHPLPAVVPVVEYEPPPVGVQASAAPAARPRPNGARPRHLQLAPPATERPVARGKDAAVFADAALRRVLEVIDRRRPVAQLRPLLADELIDAVVALARIRYPATASLRRVGVRIVDRDGEAAEVFATYSRGQRIRAIAGRIAQVSTRRGKGWRIVALQIG